MLLFCFVAHRRKHQKQFLAGLVGQAMLDYVLTPRRAPRPRTDLDRMVDGLAFVESRIYFIVECKS
jgi:hypothetical protein